MNATTQTQTAYWVRNKHGNQALGVLYSGLTDRIIRRDITLSMARLEFPNHAVWEKKS